MVLKNEIRFTIIPSSPVEHLDTVTMLKYAESNKRGSAMEKVFLEVGKIFSFYIMEQQID